MVRLTDLPEEEREHLLGKNLQPLGSTPWVEKKKALSEMRIALITTAGIHRRGDTNFGFGDGSYRPIAAADADQLVMSHVSVNYDRSGFVEDLNVVLPLDRLNELADAGVIGSTADLHYSFMGAGLTPEMYEEGARDVARHLKADEVDAVFLTPV